MNVAKKDEEEDGPKDELRNAVGAKRVGFVVKELIVRVEIGQHFEDELGLLDAHDT